uniref:ER membrane protein complex subunit 6 n=1 Tax=Eimeria tenella TaxID=5802 RepID=H9B9E2_EIMTE|nr:hypothetical protein [Eimeria tenella]
MHQQQQRRSEGFAHSSSKRSAEGSSSSSSSSGSSSSNSSSSSGRFLCERGAVLFSRNREAEAEVPTRRTAAAAAGAAATAAAAAAAKMKKGSAPTPPEKRQQRQQPPLLIRALNVQQHKWDKMDCKNVLFWLKQLTGLTVGFSLGFNQLSGIHFIFLFLLCQFSISFAWVKKASPKPLLLDLPAVATEALAPALGIFVLAWTVSFSVWYPR